MIYHVQDAGHTEKGVPCLVSKTKVECGLILVLPVTTNGLPIEASPVKFKGGQILIHERKTDIIIEIHTKSGWRIAVLSDPNRTGEGTGRGSKERDLRIFLCRSRKKEQMDRHNMEQRASGTVDTTRYKVDSPREGSDDGAE